MEVTLVNTFHNTRATVRYPGGVYTIPDSALGKLCPYPECMCLATLAGFPKVINAGGVEVDLNTNNDFVLVPGESRVIW